jgi:copper chaperone CopZ
VKKIKYTTPKKGRPRKGASSKADAIRAAIKEIGGRFRPRDVVASLAKKGVTVSPAQVSTIAKSMGMRRRKAKSPSSNGSVSINHLVSVKKLADQLGGIEQARVAINALARLS